MVPEWIIEVTLDSLISLEKPRLTILERSEENNEYAHRGVTEV